MIINSEHYNLETKKDEFLNSKPFPHLQLKNFLKNDFFDDFQNTNEETKAKDLELILILMLKTKNGSVKIQNYLL